MPSDINYLAETTPDQPAVISRAEAKARGLGFFFTGRPCKRGHIAPRRASCGVCLHCARENDAAWRLKHPDKVSAVKAAWARANADRLKQEAAERYRANKPSVQAKMAEYYKANSGRIRKRVADWRQANPERVRVYSVAWAKANRPLYRELTARRRTRLTRATPSWLTPEQIAEMRSIYASAPKGYHVDHIVPLKGKTVCGLHVPWNLQLLPASENVRKSAKLQW